MNTTIKGIKLTITKDVYEHYTMYTTQAFHIPCLNEDVQIVVTYSGISEDYVWNGGVLIEYDKTFDSYHSYRGDDESTLEDALSSLVDDINHLLSIDTQLDSLDIAMGYTVAPVEEEGAICHACDSVYTVTATTTDVCTDCQANGRVAVYHDPYEDMEMGINPFDKLNK